MTGAAVVAVPRAVAAAGIAVLLIGPLPRLMARSARLSGAPRTALALWSVWGLASGAGVLAAAWAAAGALAARPEGPPTRIAAAIAVAGLGTWMTARLVWTTVVTWHRRAGHRRAVRAVGRDRGDGTVLVPLPVPLAYCAGGLLRPTVVVTTGCQDLVPEPELRAVVAHERAHGRGHHDVLLAVFVAWTRTLPGLVGPRVALRAVRTATELIADEAAARVAGPDCTIRAIRRMSTGRAGPSGPDPWRPDDVTLVRVRRLLGSGSAAIPAPLDAVRLVRCGGAAVVAVGLAAAAHTLAGGAAPAAGVCTVAVLALTVAGLPATAAGVGSLTVATGSATAQLGLHILFAVAMSAPDCAGHPPAETGGMAMCEPGWVAAVGGHTAVMTAAHVLAGLLATWWLCRGQAVAARMVRAAERLVGARSPVGGR